MVVSGVLVSLSQHRIETELKRQRRSVWCHWEGHWLVFCRPCLGFFFANSLSIPNSQVTGPVTRGRYEIFNSVCRRRRQKSRNGNLQFWRCLHCLLRGRWNQLQALQSIRSFLRAALLEVGGYNCFLDTREEKKNSLFNLRFSSIWAQASCSCKYLRGRSIDPPESGTKSGRKWKVQKLSSAQFFSSSFLSSSRARVFSRSNFSLPRWWKKLRTVSLLNSVKANQLYCEFFSFSYINTRVIWWYLSKHVLATKKWAMNKHASPSEDKTTIIDCYDISLQASLSFSWRLPR